MTGSVLDFDDYDLAAELEAMTADNDLPPLHSDTQQQNRAIVAPEYPSIPLPSVPTQPIRVLEKKALMAVDS